MQLVFYALNPALVGSSLAKFVTLRSLLELWVSLANFFLGLVAFSVAFFFFFPASFLNPTLVELCRWFMPLNVLLTFIIGSVLGWLLIKITNAPKRMRGMILGSCAAGRLYYIWLVDWRYVCRSWVSFPVYIFTKHWSSRNNKGLKKLVHWHWVPVA